MTSDDDFADSRQAAVLADVGLLYSRQNFKPERRLRSTADALPGGRSISRRGRSTPPDSIG